MDDTLDYCQWYGISCDGDKRVTGIDLRDNNLAGQFPVYTRTTTPGTSVLESMWAHTKYGLANLYSLKKLDLADNTLTGTIEYLPLYNLLSLTHFDVSGNQLSGEVDALVSPSVTHADFSNNRFTSMRLEMYKVSPVQTLRFCDVSNNAIQTNATDIFDNIPPNIEEFFASNNQFFGSLPESLDNLPELRQFDMSSNALSGELPGFAESILSLQELDMSNQSIGFTGSIPQDIWRLQSLKILSLAGNKLSGIIPPAIGNMVTLNELDLSSNVLISSIPSELGVLVGTLKRLGLANNRLSGIIPSQIGQLQGASVLLNGNMFRNSSTAPLSLCLEREVEDCDLANDTTLCPIERNALSAFYDSAKGAEWTDGSLWLDEYASCCNWKGVTCKNNQVTQLNLANNGLSGRMSESIGNLTFIEVMDLSDNDMKGSIPTEIGLLSELTYLRLSYNAFTGAVPEGLGALAGLQLLQLQSNRITELPNTTISW
ncbi:leucine-rich repeat domain-containing protein [Skeletonema marinoi]|uniref:Leucine-rich repeat domain-containing protein n=1 Tax=Skeletonema marinoi TaxID=267567 RepID=A0AAD9D5T7_9STRA|nr:leucine-rich repeat domain-containing protein [Skeletonema marinoi]